MIRRRRRGFLLALVLGGTACVDLRITPPVGDNQPPGNHPIANPSFSRDIQPILTLRCATSSGCHLGPSSALGLDLRESASLANLVNVPARLSPNVLRVKPLMPDGSFLIWMMEADAARRNGARRMPLSGDTLRTAVVQTMKNWITNGASNN